MRTPTPRWLVAVADLHLRPVATVEYRYELRRGEDLVATGHLARQQPVEEGERLVIGGQPGIARVREPLLADPDPRLVVQLLREDQ